MITPNTQDIYATFELSERDYIEGCLLNPVQRARIQNLRMEVVEQKLALTPSSLTAADKESYWQQEAYLRGQLELIDTLLVGAKVAAESLAAPTDTDLDSPTNF